MSQGAKDWECFIKVKTAEGEQPCGRLREKLTDLCCSEHWKMVPKRLKRPLIDANTLRSYRERERASIEAATAVVDYIKGLFIQLPPAMKLEAPVGGADLKIGDLVQHDEKKLVSNPKLIIPGR